MKVYIKDLPDKKKQVSIVFDNPSFLTGLLKVQNLHATALFSDKGERDLCLTALNAILKNPDTFDQISFKDRREIVFLRNVFLYNMSWEIPDDEISMKAGL